MIDLNVSTEPRREKKDGRGVTDPPAKGPKIVYETPDYRVILAVMSGPADTPEEIRFRYLVQHKTHGVVYGTAAGYGQAVIAALTAQAELQNANRIASEQAARNFEASNGDQETTSPSQPQVPRFS